MKLQHEFMQQFKFDPSLAYMVGIERECFLVDANGNIVPYAERVLDSIAAQNTAQQLKTQTWSDPFGYELSACQIECRTPPLEMTRLASSLQELEDRLAPVLCLHGLSVSHVEVAPDDMPLDVYPDPTGRYATITQSMSDQVLLAACRIIGTHVHVGMPDKETALRTYNRLVHHCKTLCALGDNSCGRRLDIYTTVAPKCYPGEYHTWDDVYEAAVNDGFVDDIGSWWSLIRITKYGTIEFRMFGTTSHIPTIVDWAATCRRLCVEAGA